MRMSEAERLNINTLDKENGVGKKTRRTCVDSGLVCDWIQQGLDTLNHRLRSAS
jgi:hypothetical protein